MNLDTLTQPGQTRCRALSIPFLKNFSLTGGLYKPLVELVKKNKDLHFELRGQLDFNKPEVAPPDEAIGIYYKGNNILGLHSNHRVDIHDAFTRGLNIPKYLHNPDDVQAYLRFVPELMYRVASRGKKSMEIEYEQMIIRANNLETRNNSEYIIIANQYSIGAERWDLLALKWPRRSRGGKNPVGHLVLIEVKYALNTDIQNADQQLGRYYDYINRNLDFLCTEMELILSQKLGLGLIKRKPEQLAQLEKLRLSRDIGKVEMILYLVDYNPNSIWKNMMIRKAMQLPFKSQIRIKIGGLAMWEQSSTALEEAALQLRK
jgi:hypothetical protein